MTLSVHATCVDVGGHAVLLRGPPGSGKSDLALRLIDGGAVLVADDWTELTADGGGALLASPPETIAGMIEVRGIGLVRLPHLTNVPLALVVDLVPAEAVDRLPESSSIELAGIAVPLVSLAAFEASAAAKVRLAVRRATGDIISAND